MYGRWAHCTNAAAVAAAADSAVVSAGVAAVPFRVCSYNIQESAPAAAFPWCHGAVLAPDRRRAVAASELALYDADVVCLQGLAPRSLEQFWELALRCFRCVLKSRRIPQ